MTAGPGVPLNNGSVPEMDEAKAKERIPVREEVTAAGQDRRGREGKTLEAEWRRAARRLADAGVEEPKANAERLLLHVLGLTKAELLRDWREPFPEARRTAWEAALDRKARGEPVQYIVGEQHFFGRPFRVNPAVLIPRPETELLAEAVLAALPADEPLTVLDVGTGSGALAVTFAAERPRWRVIASDLSDAALDVARGNAARHGVADRIRFVRGDLLEPFLAGADRNADREAPDAPAVPGPGAVDAAEAPDPAEASDAPDVIVSNPPYIPSGELPRLQREVAEFEPRLALDGGADGLDAYRRMAAQLAELPKMPRLVAWETGAGQAGAVAELLRAAADWDEIRMVRDYAGIDRHVLALRRENGNSARRPAETGPGIKRFGD